MNKTILTSTLPLVVILVLFLVVGNFGIGRIKLLRSQITQVEKDKTTLTQKLGTLQEVNSTVSIGSTAATNALPGKNPALTEFFQLKNLAQQNGVALTALKSGSEVKDTSGISRVNISFDVIGARPGIMAFLSSIEKAAPITLVDKIVFSESASEIRAGVIVKTFWAAFPESIPSVTQKISDITADDRATLQKVSALIKPQFVELPAAGTTGKTDPFSP